MTAVLPTPAPAAAATLPPGRPGHHRTVRRPSLTGIALRATGRWTLRALIAVAVAAFLGLAIGPHVFGYRTLTMLTGSMAPGIDPGDVVVSTPLDIHDVEVGMVITYHIPIDDHRVVTHRVIDVQRSTDGQVTVHTQGDANTTPDPWTAVLTGDTAYQMQAVIPEIGHAIAALRNPLINQTLIYGLPTLTAAWLLLTIWRPTPTDQPEDDDRDRNRSGTEGSR